jgi:DinB superfamily
MSQRATQLFQTADDQISDLIALLDAADDAALRAPCAGREKLGDGSVAAVAMHTADNYHRIAEYLDAGAQSGHRTPDRRHRIPMFGGAHNRRGGHGHSSGAGDCRSDKIDPRALLERLDTARARLRPLAELSDERLAAVPPASDMRFADGQRTLEQIVVSLLNHQRHQCDALSAALAGSGRAV